MIPVLMQDQCRSLTFRIRLERNLCIDDFQEEVVIVFSEDLGLRLRSGLPEQMAALSRDGDDEARRQFVASYVVLENRGIDNDFFSFFRRGGLAGDSFRWLVGAIL